MSKAKETTPTLNPNLIKATLEEYYNTEQAKVRDEIRAKIDRTLMESKPEEYAPLTKQVDALMSQQLNETDYKKLVSDISNARKNLHKEEKKEEKVPAVIADLKAEVDRLVERREAEATLKTNIRKAKEEVANKLKADNKTAKEKYSELCREHRKSENKKDKLVTSGLDSLYQQLSDNLRDFTKFIKCHNLYAMMITDAVNEFIERFCKTVQEVDEILASFPLGRFMLSFHAKELATLPDTSYLTTFIQSLVVQRDCSLSASYRERLREVFTNFMLVGVDCLVILYNSRSSRIAYEDMIAYFLSLNNYQHGFDQVFNDQMTGYLKTILAANKRKPASPEQAQPAA